MFKNLQRTLVATALLSGSIAANSQSFSENFQSWEFKNYKNSPGDDVSGTCDPVTDPSTGGNTLGNGFVPSPIPGIEKTVVYGDLSVKYTITNGGVSPKCNAKSAYGTASSPSSPVRKGVSVGYVSINKAALNSAPETVGGIFQTSILPRVDTLHLALSATGSAKIAKIFTSADGNDWTPLLPYAGAPTENAYAADKTGTVYNVIVKQSNIMIKIESYVEVIRIHDFAIRNAVTSGLSNEPSTIGSNLLLNDNQLTISSINNGYFEIIDQSGVVILTQNFSAGNDATATIQRSGFYIVRIFSNNQMAVKKIVIK